jgi:TPR repeat protein
VIVDLEPDDSALPFCGFRDQDCDIYRFGLFLLEILDSTTQTEILDQLWHFEAFVSNGSPLRDFALSCLSFEADIRPSFTKVSDFFTTTAHTLTIYSDPIPSLLGAHDDPFSLLLRGLFASDSAQIPTALSLFTRIPNNPISLNNTAKLIIASDKSSASLSKALSLMSQSASLDYAVAQHNLGCALLAGVGIPRDVDRARFYLKSAADQGYVESMIGYAMEARSFDNAVSAVYLRAAARKTEPRAIHMYGLALEQGIGFENERSVDYFRIGAALGYGESINDYAARVGDFETANGLWRKAAEMGVKHAAYNLAVSYVMGRGIEKDEQAAARWMKVAADQKHTGAMFNYAMMLRDGIGVEKDEAGAVALCKAAAAQRASDFGAVPKPRKE